MALLPEEFGRPQEETGHLLPAHDVGPLIDQQRKVAPGLDPFRVHAADDRLGGRSHGQTLLELVLTAVRNPGDFRRKALDVLGLLRQEALRDEQREVRVHVTGCLDAGIQKVASVLPQRVAVGTDDHAALDRRVVREFRPSNDVDIPTREVF